MVDAFQADGNTRNPVASGPKADCFSAPPSPPSGATADVPQGTGTSGKPRKRPAGLIMGRQTGEAVSLCRNSRGTQQPAGAFFGKPAACNRASTIYSSLSWRTTRATFRVLRRGCEGARTDFKPASMRTSPRMKKTGLHRQQHGESRVADRFGKGKGGAGSRWRGLAHCAEGRGSAWCGDGLAEGDANPQYR